MNFKPKLNERLLKFTVTDVNMSKKYTKNAFVFKIFGFLGLLILTFTYV